MVEEEKEIKKEENDDSVEEDIKEKFKCARCGSKHIYTLISGVRVCRRCGFRE